MDIYLPIAGQSVNALFIVVLGFLVGLLSGMFGVGGGFLTTPLLIFYGIPPTVAVASVPDTDAMLSSVLSQFETSIGSGAMKSLISAVNELDERLFRYAFPKLTHLLASPPFVIGRMPAASRLILASPNV